MSPKSKWRECYIYVYIFKPVKKDMVFSIAFTVNMSYQYAISSCQQILFTGPYKFYLGDFSIARSGVVLYENKSKWLFACQ